MLDDEIRKASRVNTKNYRRLGIALLVTLGLGAIILLILQISSQQTETLTQPPLPITNGNSFTADENNQARDKFKHKLVEFEQQIASIEATSGMVSWSADRFKRLIDGRELALNNFANKDYAEGLKRIVSGFQQATQLVSDWQQAFANKLSAATDYFNEGDEARTELNINQALSIKPGDTQVLALRKRLKVLPEIKQLLAEVNIAEIENNQQRQVTLLREILKLDPDRKELVAKLSLLGVTLKDSQFTDVINQGLQSIERGQIDSAVRALNKAVKIDSGRHEIGLLRAKIVKAKSEAARTHFLRQIDRLISEDKWRQLQQMIQASSERYDNIPKTQRSLELSSKILTLEARLDDYLTRPNRLGDSKINQQASFIANNSQSIAQNSLRVTQKLIRLKKLIILYSKEIMVTVNSDNKTNISIEGQGNIGKTMTHPIKLKPGNYVFQGERKGYRSKRINLFISPQSKAKEVTIICDEKI